jgi:GR25 family glycosyltransferase involved in LPS biosynthesis
MERFDQQAKGLGIEYKRFSAVEAEDPKLGCKLSHVSVLSMCRSDSIFVFEDDSIFVDDFQQKFEEAMNSVPQDWNMIYLGAHLLQKEPVNNQWVRSIESSSTHAYAVKKDYVSRLIRRAMSVDGHVDVAFSSLHKEIITYAARPTLVYQGPSHSDILGDEVDYTYLYF